MSFPSFKIFADQKSTTVDALTVLSMPAPQNLDSVARPGSLAYYDDIPYYFSQSDNRWVPFAAGSGSATPAMTGVENIGTAPSSLDVFKQYDLSQPTEKIAQLRRIAPGTNTTLTYTNDSIVINSAGGSGSSILSDGGTAIGHSSLVENGVAPNLATKGLVAGPAISLSSTATDVTISSTATLTDAGTGLGHATLVNNGAGPAFAVKGITQGSGITLTSTATDVIIAAVAAPTTSLADGGAAIGHQTLVSSGAGPMFLTKGLVAGAGVSISADATDITVASTTSLADAGVAGGHVSLVNNGVGPALTNKGMVAGTGISLSTTATDVTITSTTSLVDGGAAIGHASLVENGVGPALAPKGLVAGSGITLSTTATDVTITSTATPPIPNTFAMFYGLTTGTGNVGPTDYAATIAVKTTPGTGRVPFPRDGPASGLVRVDASSFTLPAIGTYEVFFRAHTTEPGQLQLELQGVDLPETVFANMNPTAGGHPIICHAFVTTLVVNSVLAVINPSGNTPALTITPANGASTHAISQSIEIKRIA